MKLNYAFSLVIILLLATTQVGPSILAVESHGPKMDVLRFQVIKRPDNQIMAMQTSQIDALSGLMSTGDIEKLAQEGFTITSASLGFHIFFIGFNVRPDQSYRRPEITFWPLADVNFRHTLAHCFHKEAILAALSAYIKNPIKSMVPPSFGQWHNPNVDGHPYNLGDPFADTVYPNEHSACGILRYGGYNFVDADGSGTVTSVDYWLMPNGDALPDIRIFTPAFDVAPQTYGIIEAWIEDARQIGLAGTSENGWRGLIQEPEDPYYYLDQVYLERDFDAYVVAWNLGRFPDYLYNWFHSSLICPPGYICINNVYGVNDPVLDELLETIKFSLNHTAKVEAIWAAQERLADGDQPWGLPTIPIYSRNFFDAFNPGLRGIVNSPGYGTDNMWTYLNIHWESGYPNERIEDGRSVVIWCLRDEPDRFNPLSGNVYAWEFMDRVFDPLVAMNPHNHKDIPWIATNWEVVETPNGMDVTYHLRNDVFWQDGYQYTAWDAEFSLEFIRGNQIPNYYTAWRNIVDVEVINNFTFTVHANVTSQFLPYKWVTLAVLLPPQVWDRPWSSLDEILSYDLTGPYDIAPGYGPGPTPPPTNLFGTGPFIFQFYDATNLHGDLWTNRNYFLTTAGIQDLKTEMFHEVGDVNYDGVVNVLDITLVSFSYGYFWWEPEYNPDADINQDGIVDIADLATAAYHLGRQREYP